MKLISYLFWPNLGVGSYTSTKVQVLLAVCVLLIVASIIIRIWRKRMKNPVLKKLSRSWSGGSSVFGILGIILVISRVEGVSYLSMRFMWVIWFVSLFLYVFVQFRLFRARYYKKLPVEKVIDPRAKYLPGKRK